jgi:hypothetical protein
VQQHALKAFLEKLHFLNQFVIRIFIGRNMLAFIFEIGTLFEKNAFVYCIFTAALKMGSDDDDELFL